MPNLYNWKELKRESCFHKARFSWPVASSLSISATPPEVREKEWSWSLIWSSGRKHSRRLRGIRARSSELRYIMVIFWFCYSTVSSSTWWHLRKNSALLLILCVCVYEGKYIFNLLLKCIALPTFPCQVWIDEGWEPTQLTSSISFQPYSSPVPNQYH